VPLACTSKTPDDPVRPRGDRDADTDTDADTDSDTDSDTGNGGNADDDGDGLTNAAEAALGTDPDAADTDGDGYSDGAEVDANTDPTNARDKPYQAGWAIDACRDDVTSTGNSPGQVSDDFALMDQFGETVHLQDFCDRVVYMVFQAFW
jgi:hypothetical protein